MKLVSIIAAIGMLAACAAANRAMPVATIDERPAMASPRFIPPPADQSDVIPPSNGVADVTVTGVARIRATRAVMITEFSSRDAGAAASREVTIADAQPIVDALVKYGIPREAITESERWTMPNHEGAAPGTVTIRAVLPNTDPTYVRTIASRIYDAEGYPVYHAFSSVDFHIDDCAQLMETARKIALEQARAQAKNALRESRQRLGAIRSIQERNAWISEGGCGPDMVGSDVPAGRNGNFEAANGGNVVASAQLEVGFQILQ